MWPANGSSGGSWRESACRIVYTCDTCMKRLTFRQDGGRLAGRVLDEEGAYWVFSDITQDSFHWENLLLRADGSRELVCEIFGKRIGTAE